MEPKKINRKTVENYFKKNTSLADCHAQKRKVCNIDVIKSSKPFSKFQHMY